jgi:hypothetical protein
MAKTFNVYIDEAGDEGRRVKCGRFHVGPR